MAKKRKVVPVDKWKWDGYPRHFCAATDCLFHMATNIGGIIVSTLGDYHPESDRHGKMETIGCDRYFETMTFKAKKADCKCCEWSMTSGELEWYGGYQTAKEARKGHMAICMKVAGLK